MVSLLYNVQPRLFHPQHVARHYKRENIVSLLRPKENMGAPKMTWGEIVIYRSSDAFKMLLLLFILLSNRY
jgi:hypothetical protein